MRVSPLLPWWCLLLAIGVLADESEDRRSKLPYIADAVGNSLPPPPNGPATVGSPVNLLTPDRYEFYTFDESGELVKRLMTLEEIQAIVAAGEETEGLVTFANENQPTIAFNFSQPPYTKVHNVVTNVQNVLKAQMEAHKNKPHTQPTLDTPDVSDSWSLILPSIFGNTGVDIVPDKTSGTFTTPETETIELDRPANENSLSKEGSNQIISTSSTKINEESKEVPVTEKISSTTEKPKVNPTSTSIPKTTTTTTTTTTAKPTYSTTAKPLSTTKITKKPPVLSSTTTQKPSPALSTTTKPRTTTAFTTKARPATATTTQKPRTTTTTTAKPRTTTAFTTKARPATATTTQKPRTTTTTTAKPRTTTTTNKPTTKQAVKTTPKPTTVKLTTTESQYSPTQAHNEGNYTRIQVQTVASTTPTTEKTTMKYEKISSFIPISTAAYVTERTTRKPTQTTRAPVSSTKRPQSTSPKPSSTTKVQPSITTFKPAVSISAFASSTSTPKDNYEKINVTTLTTQSVSPSTTVSSTEFVSMGHYNNNKFTGSQPAKNDNKDDTKEKEPELPLFDVALSISQIATDLGGNYRPIPTTSDLPDITKISDLNLESKDSLEIDIPSDDVKYEEKNVVDSTDKNLDNFVKITTIDPHENYTKNETSSKKTPSKEDTTKVTSMKPTMTVPTTTTIDPVLSESMEDLLSQVVHQVPQAVLNESNTENKIMDKTTDKYVENTTHVNLQSPGETTQSSIRTENVSTSKTSESSTETKKAVIASTTNKLTKPADKDVSKLSKPSSINTVFDNKSQLSSGVKDNLPKPIDNENIKSNTSEPIVNTDKEKLVPNYGSKSDLKVESISVGSDSNNIKKENEDRIAPALNITRQNSTLKEIMSEKTTASPFNSAVAVQKEQSKDEEVPLKKIETILSHSNSNRIENNNNKENNKKDTDITPKVEEFKKKIQKVNIDEKEMANDRNNSWKLISTVAPPKANEIQKDKIKTDDQDNNNKQIVLDVSQENQGLEITTKDLDEDVAQFTELCNELAFRYWQTLIENIDKRRSFVLSPYSITSMLAMMFMGARGATSGEMNEILKLDDMVTFNPHFTLKNISDSLEMSPVSGVVVSAFIREIFSDRSKGKILTFYKERAQHFYNGHVEEVNFKLISDIIRRRTNLLVKRYTWGKVTEYMKSNSITMEPPLAAFSVNIFQTDCSDSSVEGRDGEMYFVVSPNVRQRRLVPVPAVVYRDGFLAGYDPVLDATAAALGNTVVSVLFLMPGQQGNVVHAEDLESLEKRLLESNPTTVAWKRLLRTLLPRMGLELQIPRFSHKSVFNVSSTLQQMGLKDLFDAEHADLGGVIGPSKDLYLSDMVQSTSFVTCGGGVIGEQHHIEEYPETLSGPTKRRSSRWAVWDEPRDYQRAFHDPHDVGEAMHLPLHLRPRQARVPARAAQPARLKFDRPFLYFVRHNPTGMLLYVGRYNPRLLP